MILRTEARLLMLLALAAAAGCSSGQAGLHVVVTGSAAPGTDFDRLELRASRESGERMGVESFDGASVTFPLSVNFVSGEQTPAGTRLQLVAEASLNGTPVWRATGSGTLQSGQGSRVELPLARLPLSTEPLPNGANCSAQSECISGICSRGVCCDKACDGACEACNLASHVGTCVPREARARVAECAPFTCDGMQPFCAKSCATSADCVDPAQCVDGVCGPKRAYGQSCITTAQCAEGTCVGKVCCRSACKGPCESCESGTGQCVSVAKGKPGTPACTPYLCSGEMGVCPTACSNNADCSSDDFGCRSAKCVARLHTFKDDFNDGSLNNDWPGRVVVGDFSYSIVNGQLHLKTKAASRGVMYLASASTFDGRESSAQVEIINPGKPGQLGTGVAFGIQRDTTDFVGLYLVQSSLVASKQLGGPDKANEVVDQKPYDAKAMRYLRIKVSGGNTTWQYSADKANWTELTTRPNFFDMSSVGVFFTLSSTEAATETIEPVFDNVNL